ncbi:hypothetical protein [Streptomyces sp. NPDC002845]
MGTGPGDAGRPGPYANPRIEPFGPVQPGADEDGGEDEDRDEGSGEG